MITKKDLKELLDKHDPYFDQYECDTCGYHVHVTCSCGWEEERSYTGAYFSHLLEQVED